MNKVYLTRTWPENVVVYAGTNKEEAIQEAIKWQRRQGAYVEYWSDGSYRREVFQNELVTA